MTKTAFWLTLKHRSVKISRHCWRGWGVELIIICPYSAIPISALLWRHLIFVWQFLAVCVALCNSTVAFRSVYQSAEGKHGETLFWRASSILFYIHHCVLPWAVYASRGGQPQARAAEAVRPSQSLSLCESSWKPYWFLAFSFITLLQLATLLEL